jgi:hypothetical protein
MLHWGATAHENSIDPPYQGALIGGIFKGEYKFQILRRVFSSALRTLTTRVS